MIDWKNHDIDFKREAIRTWFRRVHPHLEEREKTEIGLDRKVTNRPLVA